MKLESSIAALARQRSHVLFILSNPKQGHETAFLEWYQGVYREEILAQPGVLSLQHYEQHEIDVTQGQYPRLPFRCLGICALSLDGAEQASSLIDRISMLHRQQAAAEAPTTWLHYPVSEKAGRVPAQPHYMLSLAFANPVAGKEAEFREWYATRHIRHALKIPALTSGQCFERTHYQKPGALENMFQMIAVYEQVGTPEAILASIAELEPAGELDFPTLDLAHFAEAVYRPL